MSKSEDKGRAQYNKARDAFTKLNTQDKATFVMEATFNTFGEAFKDAGKTFSDVIEKVTSEDFFDDFTFGGEADGPAADEKKESGASNGRKRKGSTTSSTSKSKKKKDGN